jgi:hemerythrin-like domain-containing protein
MPPDVRFATLAACPVHRAPEPHQEPAMSATTMLSATAAKPAAAPRVDLYAAIHKALRLFMNDTLARVGRLDHDDPVDLNAALAQLQSLLDACRSHVAKENEFVHTAIEARRPGASERVGSEHAEHLDAIAGLEAEAVALRALPTAAAAQRLYRHLARFVGENFEHMHVEESAHNGMLWSAYSDAELLEIHQRILASIEPDEMALVLRWMVPALTPAERAAMLGEMQKQMPPEAMRSVLDIVRPHLDDTAWAKLARALRIPPVPGLVTV